MKNDFNELEVLEFNAIEAHQLVVKDGNTVAAYQRQTVFGITLWYKPRLDLPHGFDQVEDVELHRKLEEAFLPAKRCS